MLARILIGYHKNKVFPLLAKTIDLVNHRDLLLVKVDHVMDGALGSCGMVGVIEPHEIIEFLHADYTFDQINILCSKEKTLYRWFEPTQLDLFDPSSNRQAAILLRGD